MPINGRLRLIIEDDGDVCVSIIDTQLEEKSGY